MSDRFRLTSPYVKITENDVEEACCKVLQLHGYMPVRQHVGKYKTLDNRRIVTMGQTGDPDWIAVKPPSFYMEVKRPGNEPSEAQLKRIAELRLAYGFEVVVVSSAEELFDWLQRLKHSP